MLWNQCRSHPRSLPAHANRRRESARARRHRRLLPVALALTIGWPSLAAGQSTAPVSPGQVRLLRAGDVDTMAVGDPGVRIAYGADSLQFGVLRLPRVPGKARVPLVIVIHGGCWTSSFATISNTSPLADALPRHGVATWNVEYRRADHPGGGWPGTFLDVARATDYVRTLARHHPIDTTRVVVAGHSAGGHLALWLAARPGLPASSPLATAGDPPLALTGVVSMGGIADLAEFAGRSRSGCSVGAVRLLGGEPAAFPERIAQGSPMAMLPLGVPSVHVAGDQDGIAPLAVREAFAAAATRAGDRATVERVDGGHFEVIAPSTMPGRRVVSLILERLGMAPVDARPPR